LARVYYWSSGATLIRGHTSVPIVFKNTSEVNIATISDVGVVNATAFIASQQITASSYLLTNGRVYSRNGGFDTWIYSDSGGMSLIEAIGFLYILVLLLVQRRSGDLTSLDIPLMVLIVCTGLWRATKE
jgi:hypothetical protein